ncbi:MAG: hypothetical protein AAGA58_06355 [Verrucomicrobiota bacterium]
MESQSIYQMLKILTEDAAFTSTQADRMIRATEAAGTNWVTHTDLNGVRQELKLRITKAEHRITLQVYSAAGLLFAAIQAFQ